MRLAHLWIVTAPRSSASTISDILFKATAKQFIVQVRGGLAEADEPAFFSEEAEAVAEAERRIAAYESYRRILDGREAGPS